MTPSSTPPAPSRSASAGAPPIDIGIPTEQRHTIAEGLGRVLADSTVLYAKTHGFHWNVTGPMFNTLHLMFMDQYTELWTALDEIAERIRALGHVAPFGGSTYSGLSSIPETEGVPAALTMVRELVEGSHKALVFSQFTDYLALLAERLRAMEAAAVLAAAISVDELLSIVEAIEQCQA